MGYGFKLLTPPYMVDVSSTSYSRPLRPVSVNFLYLTKKKEIIFGVTLS
jgi:hypothetical protein